MTTPDFSAFGKKGARRRMRALSREQRSAIARHAAKVRHQNTPEKERREAMRRAVLERWKRYRAEHKGQQTKPR